MDAHVLCSLYTSTNMEQLLNFNTTTSSTNKWNCNSALQPETPPCGEPNITYKWYGVRKCSEESYPTYINLNNENLFGTLPSLFNATYLSELVKFEIPYNSLVGSIPIEILLLPKLKYIDLGYNDLTGPLSEDSMTFSSSLKVLLVDGNQLTGTIPISLCNNSNLNTLYVTTPSIDEPSGITCYPECLNHTVDTLSIGSIPICSEISISNNKNKNSINYIFLTVILFLLACFIYYMKVTGTFHSNSKVTPLLPKHDTNANANADMDMVDNSDKDVGSDKDSDDDSDTEIGYGNDTPRVRVIARPSSMHTNAESHHRHSISSSSSSNNNASQMELELESLRSRGSRGTSSNESIGSRGNTGNDMDVDMDTGTNTVTNTGANKEYPFRGVSLRLTKGEVNQLQLQKLTPIPTPIPCRPSPIDIDADASSDSVDIRSYSGVN